VPDLPPGPRGLPAVGSFLTIRLTNRLTFLERLAATYGDVSSYHVFGARSILVNDPGLARDVLRNRSGCYEATFPPPLAALELITPPASRWTRAGDRTASVARATGSVDTDGSVDRLATIVADVVDDSAARWPPGGTVELAAEAGVLAAGLLRSALLGMPADRQAAALLGDALVFALSRGAAPRPADRAAQQQWRAAVHGLRDAALAGRPADEETTAHRAAGFAPVMLATYSPLSTALLWAAFVLATRPSLRGAVLDELGDRPLSAALGAPYLSGVIRELLRLYPPAYALTRRATADDTVGGFLVPAGTKVILSPYLLHRRPDCWPDPLEFDPERFAADGATGVHLPFGAGAKACPGQAIAVILLQLTVAALARRTRFEPAWTGPVRPAPGWALRPDRPLPARVAPTD